MAETNIKEGEPPLPPAESRPNWLWQVAVFVAGGLILGAAALGLGVWAWGEDSLTQGGTAFGLTFVPAAVTLAWVLYSYRTSPEMQLLASLGSSGIRMAIALGGGFLLTSVKPELFGTPFWFWLILFYMTLLMFEIALVVRQPQSTPGPSKPNDSLQT